MARRSIESGTGVFLLLGVVKKEEKSIIAQRLNSRSKRGAGRGQRGRSLEMHAGCRCVTWWDCWLSYLLKQFKPHRRPSVVFHNPGQHGGQISNDE